MSSELHTVLERARSLGFLGPGPLASQVEHARTYLPAIPDDATVLDLGAGGGVPGFVVAAERPDARGILLDVAVRRVTFLRWGLRELGVTARWSVAHGRAEDLVGETGEPDTVIARGFGPPAATVECALLHLSPGGRIVISEPPARRTWETESLEALGLVADTSHSGLMVLHWSGDVRPAQRPWNRMVRSPIIEVSD